MANSSNKTIKKILLLMGVILFLIIGGFSVFLLLGKNKALQLTTGKTPLPMVEDGVYIGSYEGFRWSNTVEVTVKDSKIIDIKTIKHQVFAKEETIDAITERIIMTQSTDVDTISGATADCKAYLKAVENALMQPEVKK